MADPAGELDWQRDGTDWPNREASRFITSGDFVWHVQVMGSGPALLLVHGTAASTHSWRNLMPLLAQRYSVVAMDLPGHAFTRPLPGPSQLTLPLMARALGALVKTMGIEPQVVVGHSAGAAILVRAAHDGILSPRLVVSINGALMPFRGLARHLFPGIAQLLILNPLMPRLFAWRASRSEAVRSLLENTGSKIDAGGVAIYRRLLTDRGHVASALGMMANWDLETMARDIAGLRVPLALIVGNGDRAVPPDDAFEVGARVENARVYPVPGLGHLAHEEDPRAISALIFDIAAGTLAPKAASPDLARHAPG